MIGDLVTIVNRAPWPLSVIKDGRSYKIPVGRSQMRSDVVPFAKAQNPIMGTDDPNVLTDVGSASFQSLIGVVAPEGMRQDDPLDPLPKEVLDAMPKERLDRSQMPSDRQQNVQEVKTTFPTRRVGIENPSDGMSGETKFS